jgi:flagellar hook-basal body complex protein FliE
VVAKVNETQEQEDVVTEAYERGGTTGIATVALIQSRASITFEAPCKSGTSCCPLIGTS